MASYIVLKDSTRIEIVVTGPFKQAVAKNAQGEVILTGNKLIGSDDKTLLETLALSLSSNSSLDNIQEEFIEPPPTPTPKPTPQQVNDTREKETVQRNTQQETVDNQKSDSKSIEDNTPQDNKLQGKDKFAILIAQKGQEVKKQLIPVVIGLATTAGIKAIGTAAEQLPDFCLPEAEVNKILDIRNQIVDKLNGIVNTIDAFAKTVDTLKGIVTPLDTTLTALTVARTAASIGVKFIPSPPGAPGIVVSTLNDLKDIQEQISPTITKTNGTISAISLAISVVATPLLKIINLLNSIDKYLTKCSSSLSSGTTQLTPLNNSLLNLESEQNKNKANTQLLESTYNGFTLDIVEEQFSPTIKRIRAIAKNSQGIVLLKTPLSFTTTPQVLIAELKLIIDKNYTPLSQVNTTTEEPPLSKFNPPPPPPPPPPTTTDQPTTSTQPQFTIYTTRPGDTFRKIALIYNVNIKLLEIANKNININDYLGLSRSSGVNKRIKLKIPKP